MKSSFLQRGWRKEPGGGWDEIINLSLQMSYCCIIQATSTGQKKNMYIKTVTGHPIYLIQVKLKYYLIQSIFTCRCTILSRNVATFFMCTKVSLELIYICSPLAGHNGCFICLCCMAQIAFVIFFFFFNLKSLNWKKKSIIEVPQSRAFSHIYLFTNETAWIIYGGRLPTQKEATPATRTRCSRQLLLWSYLSTSCLIHSLSGY